MTYYFNTFKPLCINQFGCEAIERFHYPKFVDHSIRREPDLDQKYPSITSICRGGNFAPLLTVGDIILYCTVKGKYLGVAEGHWRVVALLKVIKQFENHLEASKWYRSKGLPLASNCVVEGNPPLPLERSIVRGISGNERIYQERASNYPIFSVCEALYRELNLPNPLWERQLKEIFDGRIPNSQSAREISKHQLERILEAAGININISDL